MKIAGVVVLYNPTEDVLDNIKGTSESLNVSLKLPKLK